MNRKIITGLLFLFSTISSYSQENEIESYEIKIVKDYNVFIEEATKINIPITYKPQFKVESKYNNMNYDLPDRVENFEFEPSSIQPIDYKASKGEHTDDKNYIKFGFGTNLNPIVDWSHTKLKSKTPWKFQLNHNSAWKEQIQGQKYSETRADFGLEAKAGKFKVSPSFGINHKYYSFYGNLEESQIKQTITNQLINPYGAIDFNKETFEAKKLSILNHLDMGYGMGSTDTQITTKAQDIYLTAYNQLIYKFTNNLGISNDIRYDLENISIGQTLTKYKLGVMPKISFKNKTMDLIGGINFCYAKEYTSGDFYFLPNLETNLHIVPNIFNFYTKWNRHLDLNTYTQLFNSNPYVLYNINNLPISRVENRTAGLQGQVKNFIFNAFFNQKIIKNAILFVNDSANPRFLRNQVDNNLTVNNISGELTYQRNNFGSIFFQGGVFLYELDKISTHYNLPTYKLTLGFHLALQKKWSLTMNNFVIGGVKSMINNQVVASPFNFDINLSGEYLINKKFFIFANLNNLLNTKVIQNIGYPSYGINMQLGLRVLY